MSNHIYKKMNTNKRGGRDKKYKKESSVVADKTKEYEG